MAAVEQRPRAAHDDLASAAIARERQRSEAFREKRSAASVESAGASTTSPCTAPGDLPPRAPTLSPSVKARGVADDPYGQPRSCHADPRRSITSPRLPTRLTADAISLRSSRSKIFILLEKKRRAEQDEHVAAPERRGTGTSELIARA